MNTPPDKRIVFTFYSHPMQDVKLRWKATLAFEPGSSDETPATLAIADGEGVPIAEGRFELAGQRLEVNGGAAAIRCGDFVKGKHEQAIWLHRKGRVSVPGALTFE